MCSLEGVLTVCPLAKVHSKFLNISNANTPVKGMVYYYGLMWFNMVLLAHCVAELWNLIFVFSDRWISEVKQVDYRPEVHYELQKSELLSQKSKQKP